jgi:hypothetical protein
MKRVADARISQASICRAPAQPGGRQLGIWPPAVRRGTRQFVVGRHCAKAGPLLPIGGRDAGWCAIGQC